MTRRFIALAFLAVAALPAGAIEPGERLPDPALEARARALSKELRCLVCQNQSIDESDAPLARDLRLLVRQRLSAGAEDAEVLSFVTDRYGDFVRLRPPFRSETLLLWLGPALVLAAGVALLWRRRRSPPPSPLTEGEERRLAALMDRGDVG